MLVRLGGKSTTSEMIGHMHLPGRGVTLSTMCNRLNRLVDLGLVVKSHIPDPTGGHIYLWQVAPTMYDTEDE